MTHELFCVQKSVKCGLSTEHKYVVVNTIIKRKSELGHVCQQVIYDRPAGEIVPVVEPKIVTDSRFKEDRYLGYDAL